jgi:hypothetical protein
MREFTIEPPAPEQHRCIVCDSMDADFAFGYNYGEAPQQIWMCHHHVWDFILAQAKKERARLGIKTEVEP